MYNQLYSNNASMQNGINNIIVEVNGSQFYLERYVYVYAKKQVIGSE